MSKNVSDAHPCEVRVPIRLGQFLQVAGICGTGAEAAELIAEQLVVVDDQVCTQRGKQLRGGEIVYLDVVDGPPPALVIAG